MTQDEIVGLLERARAARQEAVRLRPPSGFLEAECRRMEARLEREQATFDRASTADLSSQREPHAPRRLTPAA